MTNFTKEIANLRFRAENKRKLENKIEELKNSYNESYDLYSNMLSAQRVLATVSDEHSKRILGYIQGIVNRSLRSMFPNESYNIQIKKKLHANTHPHIIVELHEIYEDGDSQILDFSLQSGDGMGQIVSFLFSLCLIKIREARPIIALDEVLRGFHEDALPFVRSIIEIFAKGGFQFLLVEYAFEGFGKEYIIDKGRGGAEIREYDREAELEEQFKADLDLEI